MKLKGCKNKLEPKQLSWNSCGLKTHIPHRLVRDITLRITLFWLISKKKKAKNRKPCHGNEFTPNFGLNKSVSTGITFPEES